MEQRTAGRRGEAGEEQDGMKIERQTRASMILWAGRVVDCIST